MAKGKKPKRVVVSEAPADGKFSSYYQPQKKYKKTYPNKIVDYFLNRNTEYSEEIVEKDGEVVSVKKISKGVSFPTFEGFANFVLNVSTASLYNWEKEYPEFKGAMERCREIQKSYLINHSIHNNYSTAFAKFLGENLYDMKEKVSTEIKYEYIAADEDVSDDGD